MTALALAADLLREARSRRWILALVAGTTVVLAVVALGLRLEVVDGALATTRLFGGSLGTDVQAVDVALRPLFAATAYLVFYGGIALGVVATADFAPALLAPGRIEHLLALPVRRWEVLAGTFAGVELLVLAGATYGGAGMVLILWVKTGVLNAGPVAGALAAAIAFAPVYAAMLATAVAARSAALSGCAGLTVLVAGILAGERSALSELFSPGASRGAFLAITAILPRLSRLGAIGARVAESRPIASGAALAVLAGSTVFALALLALAAARFERKDY